MLNMSELGNPVYVKKNLSIPLKMLRKMDKEAKEMGVNRSEFIRHLFTIYLNIDDIKEEITEIKAKLEEAG